MRKAQRGSSCVLWKSFMWMFFLLLHTKVIVHHSRLAFLSSIFMVIGRALANVLNESLRGNLYTYICFQGKTILVPLKTQMSQTGHWSTDNGALARNYNQLIGQSRQRLHKLLWREAQNMMCQSQEMETKQEKAENNETWLWPEWQQVGGDWKHPESHPHSLLSLWLPTAEIGQRQATELVYNALVKTTQWSKWN